MLIDTDPGRRQFVAVVFVGVLGASTAGVLQASATAPAPMTGGWAAAPTAVVATGRLDDTKAVLTAARTPEDTATVRLTVYAWSDGDWRSLGTEVVGKRRGWFWHVVSGPAAVCDFSVSDNPGRAVSVRLAVSASIGCDAVTRHFHVESGDLVPG